MLESFQKVLSKALIFEDIKLEDLNSLINCVKPKISSYKKNEYIALEGEKLEGLGCILEGNAAVIRETSNGSRNIMTLLKPGDMFGEMAVFSKNPVWPATVFAQEACSAFYIPPQKIIGECNSICPWHRQLIQNMLKVVSEKALMLNRKLEYVTIKSMRGKLSVFFLEQRKRSGAATFVLPMNRSELADFLNVSRPSMSRELCRMRDEGIIDFHMSSVRILDEEALRGCAEDN